MLILPDYACTHSAGARHKKAVHYYSTGADLVREIQKKIVREQTKYGDDAHTFCLSLSLTFFLFVIINLRNFSALKAALTSPLYRGET